MRARFFALLLVAIGFGGFALVWQTAHSDGPLASASHGGSSPVARVVESVLPSLSSREAAAAPAQPPAADAARFMYAQAWRDTMPKELAAFRDWTDRYLAAGADERAPLESEGVALARARRPIVRELIMNDPARALATTVPAAMLAHLPIAVRNELEQRIEGTGDLSLQCALVPGDKAEEQRIAVIGGASYVAHVYGRRAGQLTKDGASLHGVAIDGQLAIHEQPLHVLEPGEMIAASTTTDPLRGGTVTTAQLHVAVHGRTWPLAAAADLPVLAARLVEAEAAAGPAVAPLLRGDNTTATAALQPRISNTGLPNSWTTGAKQVLVLRVDFPDNPGDPLSASTATSIINTSVSPFFDGSSYGRTQLNPVASPKLYRLPLSTTSYANNNYYQLHVDATNAAGADYNIASYDRVVVVFNSRQSILGTITGGGVAAARGEIGGSRVWVENSWNFSYGVLTHELGHTYGLLHANLWQVTDGNPISNSGTSEEYGDRFDIMGAYQVSVDPDYDFNMWEKNWIGWLPSTQVRDITTSGTYRIFRFDKKAAGSSTQPLALRVFRDGGRSYWIGLRQYLAAGKAYVLWGNNTLKETQLLQLGGISGAFFSPLAIGQSFTDPTYGITLRPIAQGGAEPSQYLDIEVTLPAVPAGVIAQWGAAMYYAPSDLSGVVSIAVAGQRVLALKSDGSLASWNATSPLAVPDAVTSIRSIAIGSDTSGVVKADGTVQLWGDSKSPAAAVPAGLNNVRQLALGGQGTGADGVPFTHGLVLRFDGTVIAWGDNRNGQTAVPSALRDVVAIAAGDLVSVALKADGTVVQWGYNFVDVPRPTNLTGVTAIAAGPLSRHVLALKSDGTVLAWGANYSGQCNVPSGLTNVIALAAGSDVSLALKADGTIVAWGSTVNGPLDAPVLPRVAALAAGLGTNYALVGAGPIISAQPRSTVATTGTATTLSVEVLTTNNATYQWRKNGVAITGATGATLAFASASPSDTGFYDVVVTSSGIAATSLPSRLSVSTPIAITRQPESQTIAFGETLSLSVVATGGDHPLTYQWRANGFAIAGATGTTYTLSNFIGTGANYDVAITDGTSTTISAVATVKAVAPVHIANLSVLATTTAADPTFTVGFVTGTRPIPVVLRAVGPSLAQFGMTGVLPAPTLQLFTGPSLVASNAGWGGSSVFSGLFNQVGAFPLSSPASRDSVIYRSPIAGPNTIQIGGVGGATGAVLAEIYDATTTSFDATPSLTNVSVLKTVAANDTLTAGFVLTGRGSRQLLIRAVGPTLGAAPFKVANVMTSPQLVLNQVGTTAPVASNTGWAGDPAIAATAAKVGAFALVAGSKDAALLVSLPAGNYTAQAPGIAGGAVLLEIYAVP